MNHRILLLCALFAFSLHAGDDRTNALFKELRCVVCEGQSLYDSHALVAEDMKAEIRSQIAQGRSDQEIKTFLIERYGDHVLMKTPVNARTGLLWIFPLLVLLIGLWFVRKLLRRKFTRP